MSQPPAKIAPAAPGVSIRLKWFLRVSALAFAVVQAWHSRHEIKPDGVSYLDIADAYLRGDWHAAISTYWSPLYSWLLAVGLAVFRPSPYWEFAVAKIVNLVVFLAALAAFEWFAHEAKSPRLPSAGEQPETSSLPRGILYTFAYALFLWSSCVLTSLGQISPDLLVSGFVYLLAAWVLRARRVAPGLAGSAIFGLVLGVGCLAKAALLPLGALFLLTSLFSAGSVRQAVFRLGAAGVVLAVVLGGWVGAMYWKSGRVTLGDVSKLNYIWLVNGVKDHGWDSDDACLGQALRPPRQIATKPPIYEFSPPRDGTYPLWYDPPRWCEGLTMRFDLRQQLAAVAGGVRAYYNLFSSDLLPFTGALALLHLGTWLSSPGGFRARLAPRLRALLGEYALLIPSLGACGLYGLVVVEPRYLTGFVVLLGMALLRAVQYSRDAEGETRRWSWAVVVIVVLAPTVWLMVREEARAAAEGDADANVSWQVAEAMHQRGVGPGAAVASIGSPFECGWARVGRFQIVAEVRTRDVHAFWAADPAQREAVLEALRDAGAAAVTARDVPETERGWERVAGTDYSFWLFGGGD